ncbi:MAG TPA: hypothetical protein VI895_14720 [Bdellovibrionota bacterium]|nr:hypothetical protein [Bdellovibrionota bacterium]
MSIPKNPFLFLCFLILSFTACGTDDLATSEQETLIVPTSDPTATPTPTPTPTPAPGKRMGWIISPSDGVVRTHCVTLQNQSSTAFDTLEATGESLVTLDFCPPGGCMVICAIGDVGRPADNCFGATYSDPNWLYFYLNDLTGQWTLGDVAISEYPAQDAALLGFVYTGFTLAYPDGVPVREPPMMSFASVCPN